jgi:hypothetical protein
MNNAAKFVLAVVVCMVLVACQTANELNDANEQLSSYYYAKTQAADDPLMEEAAIASLRDLGRESAEHAAAASDPLNKISFYRIAATAAWQAKDPIVVQYAKDGSDACKNQWTNAPRDCGMLTFIDDLAAIDETTAEYNKIKADGATPAGVVEIVKTYQGIAETMIDNRAQLETSVPASLLLEYDTKIDDLVCKLFKVGAVGLAITEDAPIDGVCRLGNLRLRARDSGVELPACTGPLPAAMVDQCD